MSIDFHHQHNQLWWLWHLFLLKHPKKNHHHSNYIQLEIFYCWLFFFSYITCVLWSRIQNKVTKKMKLEIQWTEIKHTHTHAEIHLYLIQYSDTGFFLLLFDSISINRSIDYFVFYQMTTRLLMLNIFVKEKKFTKQEKKYVFLVYFHSQWKRFFFICRQCLSAKKKLTQITTTKENIYWISQSFFSFILVVVVANNNWINTNFFRKKNEKKVSKACYKYV